MLGTVAFADLRLAGQLQQEVEAVQAAVQEVVWVVGRGE